MIELTHDFINDLLSKKEGCFGTYCWLNVLTIRHMEKALRKAKGIPFYYGLSEFDLNYDTCIFKPWPFYYIDSYKMRKEQLRRRIGKWLFGITVRLRK